MELDQPSLQLLFNLVAITAITSLAIYCALLKRDKRRLISELNHRYYRDGKQTGASKSPSPNTSKAVRPREPVGALPPAPEASPVTDGDIRQFVARRLDGWIARSQSSFPKA